MAEHRRGHRKRVTRVCDCPRTERFVKASLFIEAAGGWKIFIHVFLRMRVCMKCRHWHKHTEGSTVYAFALSTPAQAVWPFSTFNHQRDAVVFCCLAPRAFYKLYTYPHSHIYTSPAHQRKACRMYRISNIFRVLSSVSSCFECGSGPEPTWNRWFWPQNLGHHINNCYTTSISLYFNPYKVTVLPNYMLGHKFNKLIHFRLKLSCRYYFQQEKLNLIKFVSLS